MKTGTHIIIKIHGRLISNVVQEVYSLDLRLATSIRGEMPSMKCVSVEYLTLL